MYRHYSPQYRFSKQAEMDYSQMLSPFASEGANKALYTAGGGLLGAGAGALLSKLMGGSALKGGLIGGGLGAGAGYFGRGALQNYLAKAAPAAPDTTTDSARMNPLRGAIPAENPKTQRAQAVETLESQARKDFEEEQNKGQTDASREAEYLESERSSALAEEAGIKQREEKEKALANPDSPQFKQQKAIKSLASERDRITAKTMELQKALDAAKTLNRDDVVDEYAEKIQEMQKELATIQALRSLFTAGTGDSGSLRRRAQELTGLTPQEIQVLVDLTRS